MATSTRGGHQHHWRLHPSGRRRLGPRSRHQPSATQRCGSCGLLRRHLKWLLGGGRLHEYLSPGDSGWRAGTAGPACVGGGQ